MTKPIEAEADALARAAVGAPGPQRSPLGRRVRSTAAAYGFMGPALALVVTFFVIPGILLLILSLTNLSSANFSRAWEFIGLDNYERLFTDPFFPKIARNTFFYVFTTLIFFNLGLALVLALVTTNIPRRAGFFFRLVWLLPRLTPSVVYILMWQRLAAADPFGIYNQIVPGFLGASGQNLIFGGSPWTFVILTNGFIGASFGMIIFTSALESIPKDLLTAAKVDGASTWRIIRDIKLPMIKWPLLFIATYQTLSLLTSFEYILLLTEGGPGLFTTEVWALTSYKRAFATYFGNSQWGYGATWAIVLVTVALVLAVVYVKLFRFNELIEEPRIENL
ncbi:MAG: sugar ABC transporter permease [Acidimicrobiia bacterium]|nr:MAG: sugar ABC transporter permease [Acidimicrobiia bacterium]